MKMTIKYVSLPIVLAGTLVLSGCWSDPPFPSGVRVKSIEGLSNIGNSGFPVPGVSYTGNAVGSVGPNNTGTNPFLDGITGANGISDNPNALTDVTWNYSTDWTRAIPECGVAVGQSYIPGSGGEILAQCIQF